MRCLTAAGHFPAVVDIYCCGWLLPSCSPVKRLGVFVLSKLLLPPPPPPLSRNIKHSFVFTPRRKATLLSASSPVTWFLELTFRSQTRCEAHRQVAGIKGEKVIICGLGALLSARFQSKAIAVGRSLKFNLSVCLFGFSPDSCSSPLRLIWGPRSGEGFHLA